MHGTMSLKFISLAWPLGWLDSWRGVSGQLLYQYYDLYRRLRLQFFLLLMMGAVTPETCRVTLQ